MTDLRVAAAALHEQLWDGERGLDRVAPGVAPGVDLAALGLHAVRESALGALADLAGGRPDRAGAALDAVLALQIAAPGRPWDGTFPITAEQPLPPEEGAVEWLHWDPNWRQFLGTILAVALDRHGPALGPTRAARIEGAVVRAVAGEPEGRIPDWYTNPALLHRWLQVWVGVRRADAALVTAGEEGARRLLDRVEAAGDVDEYSSPTYDGVDLVAAALWAGSPSPVLARGGQQLLGVLGRRIGTLFHPGLGAMCGPYIRTYGLGLDRYVSLVGLWLGLLGVPAGSVLPADLSPETDHVHDLAFVPLLDGLADVVAPHLVLDGPLPRRHVQRFGPVEAVSDLAPRWALGAERGRRPTFAREQHVPLTAHAPGAWLGAAPGGEASWLDATIAGDGVVEAEAGAPGDEVPSVRLLTSAPPDWAGASGTVGPLRVELVDLAPSGEPTTDVRGTWSTLAATGPHPRLRVAVAGGP